MNRREEKQTEVPGTENVETPNLRDLAGYSSGFFGVFDGPRWPAVLFLRGEATNGGPGRGEWLD